MQLNRVSLSGNLTREIEMRYTPNGAAVANMNMAINRTWKDKEGNKQEDVSYVRVVVWGKMAENAAEYLAKGSNVFVEGRMQSRSWEKDGVKQYGMDVVASNVQYLDKKKKEDKPVEKPAEAPIEDEF